MCGIFGVVGCTVDLGKFLLKGVKRLEYRGYDSVGMAVLNENGIDIKKDIGTVDEVNAKENFEEMQGILGIAHSRWATCGGVTKENAHPHYSEDKKLAIVHNGILENYEEIKSDLETKGHKFNSETDSEVIAHYFEEKLKTKPIKEAIVDFISVGKGTFAILLIKTDEEKIYAIKRDSPLALGICKEMNILGSDIYAFSDKTDKAIFFDNDEFAVIEANSYQFFDKTGSEINKEIQVFEWEQEESDIADYDYYMIKEIMETPNVVKRLLLSIKADQKESFEGFVNLLKTSKKVIFTACGTSYHAALLGVYYLHKCGVDAQALIGSEFMHFASVDENTLVVPISQSGETMDLIEALKYAKQKGAKIASIVNVPYSSIQRMSELSLNIVAGQEVCVAATKYFTNQVTLLLAVAKEFGFQINLDTLPDRIQSTLEKKELIQKIAKEIYMHKDLYVLGRGLSYPVAREIALKIKEISYVHAEGMMGGELKHGTIALIEEGTPVISLISNKDYDMESNSKEVEARGARVIRVTNKMEGDIKLPTTNDGKFGILAAIFGQLLSYNMSTMLGYNPDKPKNLAKSCTVK